MVRKKGNDYLFVGTVKGNSSQYQFSVSSKVAEVNGSTLMCSRSILKSMIATVVTSWSQDSEISVLVLNSHMKEFVGGVSLWH